MLNHSPKITYRRPTEAVRMKIMVVKDRNVLNTKFVAQFVNDLAKYGHDVHVVCDSYRKPGRGVTLDPNVRFTNLSGKTRNPIADLHHWLRSELFPANFRYRRIIDKENPDVIICYFLKDLFNVAHRCHKARPVIQMFHCYPPLMIQNLKKKSRRKRTTYLKLLERVTVLQVLNTSFIEPLSHCLNAKRIVAIPNTVVQRDPSERTKLSVEKKKVIYIAQINKDCKRQHLLIDAFATASRNVPGWTLEFWGLEKSAKYKQELLDQAASLGLSDRIFIKGYSSNIQEVYRSADIHAFPSRDEGFGLGLADGMAMGLPSLGFQETPSVNELIKDGSNGFLAENTADFAQKLETLMSNQELRIRMGRQAAKDMGRFAPEIVAGQWNCLITETIQT